jgi:hypothetical protein
MDYTDYAIDAFVQEIIEELILPFFGDAAESLFDDTQVTNLLTIACEVDRHNRYDTAKCDMESMSHICEHAMFYRQKLRENPNASVFTDLAEQKYADLERALRKTWAFITLYSHNSVPVPSPLLPEDIAALTGLKTSTLRNVIPVVYDKSFEERLKGLLNSDRIPKIEVYDSESETEELLFPLDVQDTVDWKRRVFRRAEARNIDAATIEKCLPKANLAATVLLNHTHDNPSILMKLADTLSFERSSFAKGTLSAIYNELELKQSQTQELLWHAEQTEPMAIKRDDTAPLTAEELRDLVITEFKGALHPLYRGNKKLIGMELVNGAVLAIETSKKPQLWLNAKNFTEKLTNWLVKRYDPTTPEESLYQRHSGLRLYDDLGTPEVVKLRIKTYGDARTVLNVLS